MRTPRSIDAIGTGTLLASIGLWFSHGRTGDARALLAFFVVAGAGIALEPLARLRELRHSRRIARERHPVMRGRGEHGA
jgi:hypothetical protein